MTHSEAVEIFKRFGQDVLEMDRDPVDCYTDEQVIAIGRNVIEAYVSGGFAEIRLLDESDWEQGGEMPLFVGEKREDFECLLQYGKDI